ncbi:MAG: DNA/RNA non-specific endonuclease [Oscillatoriales cyanobacterium]|nr:MAG: DNA/RNA non-specific endonuclease [Oscillatoriales cyanobacterium]
MLLPDWSQNNESAIPDSGFTEGAADSFFASLVQLDQSLGGGAKFDSQGNFVRSQGAIFNSPLHFVGFSRGTVVNSEIIQRVGTYFPLAGGKENSLFRDLQMTTLDPHDFDQPSFSVQLPFLGEAGFADFREPKVQVWKNVTFADNYYQTVPRLDQGIPQIPTLTPAGRDIPNLSGPDALRTEIRAGLKFPRNSEGELLGKPDETVFLGTRRNADGYENSLPGFTKDDLAGGTHGRVLTWYAGTADLGLTEYRQNSSSTQPVDPISRRRGDGHYEQLFDRDFSFSGTAQDPRVNPWYTPKYSGQPNFSLGAANAPNEGIGTGWFYSVLGGGLTKDPNTGAITNLRPTNNVERVPLSFDNTAESRMRGDFAVPTLFGGNFDAVFNPRSLFRNAISNAIPGWSFHGGTSNIASPTSRLVDWRDIPALNIPRNIRNQNRNISLNYLEQVGITEPNYALKLTSGDSITHNRFVVPDWGTLRFNLHVPELSGGQLNVSIQGDAPGYENYQPIGNIDLRVADGRVNPGDLAENAYPIGYADTDTNRIGSGNLGFETFHVDVPEVLRGKSAKLKFELEGNDTVYLDDVFFKSTHLMFGNPTLNGQEARPDAANNANNYLIEKPQYSLSYNESNKGSNWVSWQLNKTWLGDLGAPNNDSLDPYDSFPWRSDSALPSELDTTEGGEYGRSGFDRGHLTAREQRNRTQKDQLATFLTTNLLPQEPGQNQRGAWRQLEAFSRTIVLNRGWELYNIAGGYGSLNGELPFDHPFNNFFNNQKYINVPELMWKVIVPLKPGQGIADVTANTPVIAVTLPNFPPYPGTNTRIQWFDMENITTVDRIEELTGLDLLSNLPDEIENILESRSYIGPVTVDDFPNVVT